MVELSKLVTYINRTLDCGRFQDYAPNGLQIEGRPQIENLVTGVTACQALLDAAIDAKADALLVHHGYFWRGEALPLTGMRRRRIGTLINADMSLLAYHLPLDAHVELGNNAQLGNLLGIRDCQSYTVGGVEQLLWSGQLPEPLAAAAFTELVSGKLARRALAVGDVGRQVQRIAWCTGGAQGYLSDAAELGCDVFISGEISEKTSHEARELGVLYLAAGHHATERYGVQALGAHLAEEFSIQHQFIDIDNPA